MIVLSSLEKEMLKCNLNRWEEFPENILAEEQNIYNINIKDWQIYGSVPKLEDWKNNIYEYPNMHISHKKVVDTIKNLDINNICEAGAGAGVVAKYVYASKEGIQLTCLEGSDKHIEQMNENFKETSNIIKPFINVKANIVKGILQDMPFENNYFDMIYTCTVMMHVPFLMVPKAIIEIARVTKKYVLHVENRNDIINTVYIGNQKSNLNRLCIDYAKIYECVGIKTVKIEEYKDPHSPCMCVYYLGEKK